MKKKKPEETIDDYKKNFFSHYFAKTKEINSSLQKYYLPEKWPEYELFSKYLFTTLRAE